LKKWGLPYNGDDGDREYLIKLGRVRAGGTSSTGEGKKKGKRERKITTGTKESTGGYCKGWI